MDQVLRSRKLGSASVRRRRMEERETAVQESKEKELKTLLYGFGYTSDDEELSEEEDDKHNTYSPTPESDTDHSVTAATPSTVGLQTPNNSSPIPTDIPRSSRPRQYLNPTLEIEPTSEQTINQITVPVKAPEFEFPTPTSKKPILQPTLTSPSDFAFDFYPPNFAVSQVSIAGSDPPGCDIETPVEIATSVLYSQPRVRPSMISIKNVAPSAKSRASIAQSSIASPRPPSTSTRSTKRPSMLSVGNSAPSGTRTSIMTRPDTPPASPRIGSRRLSTISAHSGYPACEATPFQLPSPPPPLPTEAMDMISNATHQPVNDKLQPAPLNTHKKKPSLILRRANSLRRSGINNLKSIVKDARPSASESPENRTTSPSSDANLTIIAKGASNILQSRLESQEVARPRTAKERSSSSIYNWSNRSVTALPPAPDVPRPATVRGSTFDVTRKKSFSALRDRSGSIGKLLKSASSSMNHHSGKTSISIPDAGNDYSRTTDGKLLTDLSSFPLPPYSPMRFNGSNRTSHGLGSPAMGGFSVQRRGTKIGGI